MSRQKSEREGKTMLAWMKAVDCCQLGIVFMVLTVLTLWTGNKADPHIERSPYKRPIIDFERAGSVAKAEEYLQNVEQADHDARSKLASALHWDYLFLLFYPAMIAAGCLIVINFLGPRNLWGVTLGFVLMGLQPLAALFDAVENYALLRVLKKPVSSPWPEIAYWFSTAKFGIVFAGLGFMVIYGPLALIWAKATGR
jgi:hypothetical protein